MEEQKKVTAGEGKALVRLARATIARRLGMTAREVSAAELAAPVFREKRGTFVTLKSGGRLRGCIGSLAAVESLADNIRRNAENAAFGDPRFPQLGADELLGVEVEISILSEPQPLVYQDGADLLKKIRPGSDGLVIRRGGAGATFLPQVWEQLPRPEDFLNHLCLKAGLPADAWKQGDLQVSTYQVQHFSEEE